MRWAVCGHRVSAFICDNHAAANLFRDAFWETIGTQVPQVALQYDNADALTVSDVHPMAEHQGDDLGRDVSLTQADFEVLLHHDRHSMFLYEVIMIL